MYIIASFFWSLDDNPSRTHHLASFADLIRAALARKGFTVVDYATSLQLSQVRNGGKSGQVVLVVERDYDVILLMEEIRLTS